MLRSVGTADALGMWDHLLISGPAMEACVWGGKEIIPERQREGSQHRKYSGFLRRGKERQQMKSATRRKK